ncbi:hypothetical protein I5192_16310 [Ruegeria sp. SCSIO 43209]|uniref:hypothetical protein n=1 Tax=Ruegeria sp. SCSIO 43209 TaxID=2793010 RepID=UPI00147EB729|nr:hypothetical protein [Ruegeria sp. SCSIO 43209]UAB88763.1 hypothetical protein I5192_16310 [Ruegeria sp. SCSIO 43209]
MLGLEIFVHSVRMVLRNLTQALQISVVPALIGGFLAIGLFFLFGIPFEEFNSETNGFPEGVTAASFTGFLLCLMAVVFGVMLWIVVSWHRFVLLEEYPSGLVPPFRFDRVLAYFGRLLMLGLIALIIMIPGALIMGMMAQSSVALGILVWLGLIIILTIGFYRASPILPGAAIGKPIKLSEAWQATSGASGAIALLVVLSILFQILLQLLASLLLFVPIIGVLIVLFASMLIVPLINVSILTTIYGVFIEKRELA